jgi:putative ABC transport system permease protein
MLAVSQVALSLMLLVSSLLFVGSLRNLMSIDRGFRQDGILVVNMDLKRAKPGPEQLQGTFRQLEAGLRAAPGVESVASVAVVPISGSRWNQNLRIDGPKGQSKGELLSDFNRVGPGYFRTMGAPILTGRDFNDGDTLSAPLVAIVDEAFSQKFLDGGNPVGLTLRLIGWRGESDILFQIARTKSSSVIKVFSCVSERSETGRCRGAAEYLA